MQDQFIRYTVVERKSRQAGIDDNAYIHSLFRRLIHTEDLMKDSRRGQEHRKIIT